MENCWLFGLPDLDQDNEFVREGLCDWIDWILTEYDIDGMRIDAVKHVRNQFFFIKTTNPF